MALGAKKRTRGRRDIVVEGRSYYWRVFGNDRRGMREGKLGVIIGEAKRPHRRVTLTGPGLSSTVYVLGAPQSHSEVTPGLVRKAIQLARASGWPDRLPTLDVACARNGNLSAVAES